MYKSCYTTFDFLSGSRFYTSYPNPHLSHSASHLELPSRRFLVLHRKPTDHHDEPTLLGSRSPSPTAVRQQSHSRSSWCIRWHLSTPGASPRFRVSLHGASMNGGESLNLCREVPFQPPIVTLISASETDPTDTPTDWCRNRHVTSRNG